MLQHHAADVLDRDAAFHVGHLARIDYHLRVFEAQTEWRRKDEGSFNHGAYV